MMARRLPWGKWIRCTRKGLIIATRVYVLALTGRASFAMWLWPGGALMLMVGKILEGFQRVLRREIQAATRAEKAGYATLGALIHQRGPGYRTRRQFSQNGFLRSNCTPGFSSRQ